LGVTFFFFYLAIMIKGLAALTIKKHDEKFDPLLGIFIIWSMWALFMSPFKGLTRLDITLACVSSIIAIYLTAIKTRVEEK